MKRKYLIVYKVKFLKVILRKCKCGRIANAVVLGRKWKDHDYKKHEEFIKIIGFNCHNCGFKIKIKEGRII